MSDDDVVEDAILRKPTEAHKRPPRLTKVISINGEEVNASSLAEINIHDYTVFEREQYITRKFMSTIRRKEGRGQRSLSESTDHDKEKRASFKKVAKNVMRADNVLKAMRHYNHRSDSDTDSEDEEEKPEGRAASKKRSEHFLPQRSISSPETSSLSSPGGESGTELGWVKSGTDVLVKGDQEGVVDGDKGKQVSADEATNNNNNNNNSNACWQSGQLAGGSESSMGPGEPHNSSVHVDVVSVAVTNGTEPPSKNPAASTDHEPQGSRPDEKKAGLRLRMLSQEGLCPAGCCVVL